MMEGNIIKQEPTGELKIKKFERSAAYASITIEIASNFVGEVYKNFRNNFSKREDILNLVEGSQIRHLAASSYYLLLNREKDTYQVSDLYKTINNPVSEKEKAIGLLKAFEAPKLNKELIDKFDGDQIPKEIIAHLSRFHNITPEAAPLAAEVFIENAKYCGVLDNNNVLSFKKKLLELENSVVESLQKNEVENTETSSKSPSSLDFIIPAAETKQAVVSTQENGIKKNILLLEQMVNEEKVKIRLTKGKFAYLSYPADTLTKTDVAILQKEIEKLQLMVE